MAFQNCSQPGSLNLVSDSGGTQKLAASEEQGPLVIDVVEAIDDSNNTDVTAGDTSSDSSSSSSSGTTVASGDSSSGSSSVEQPAVQQPATEPTIINNVEEVLVDNSCGARGEKVLVCHFPPGNASAKHTICIGRSALKAHMNHGHSEAEHQDYVGACVQ